MIIQPYVFRSLEPKTRKMIAKLGHIDNVASDLAYMIYAIDEHLSHEETGDGPLVLFDKEYHKLYREYKALNKILRYHLRLYTSKFYDRRPN